MDKKVEKLNRLEAIFNTRAENLGETIKISDKYKFNLKEILKEVQDETLRKKIFDYYLQDEDKLCEECSILIKKYYQAGVHDVVAFIIEALSL